MVNPLSADVAREQQADLMSQAAAGRLARRAKPRREERDTLAPPRSYHRPHWHWHWHGPTIHHA